MRSVIVYPLSGAHECAGAVATSVTILDLGSEKKKDRSYERFLCQYQFSVFIRLKLFD